MGDKKIRVLIADDHAVVREGICAILQTQTEMEVVGQAVDGEQAIALVHELKPDVILLDLAMPRLDGLEVIRRISATNTPVRILVFTSFADDERVFPAIKAGALGYLLKDAPREQLLGAIRGVARGEAVLHPAIALKMIREINRPSHLPATPDPLTERETETLRLLARGLTNEEIAAALVIHERTVAKYVSSILGKLHLANRTQATLYALRTGRARLDE